MAAHYALPYSNGRSDRGTLLAFEVEMHHHHYLGPIKYRHGKLLDTDPGWHSSQMFHSVEDILSELRHALTNFTVMSRFRGLLLPTFAPAMMTDEQVLREIGW